MDIVGTISEAIHALLNPVALLQTVGYIGLIVIVFAETGLFIGFFLPGDSLLLAAGLLAQRGVFSLPVLIALLIVAAIAGDSTGYLVGRQAGPRLFGREDARFFRRQHLLRATEFYQRHGGKTILVARFLAFVRAFAPTVAGAAGMPYPRFAAFSVAGCLLWVISMTGIGYVVGERVPNLDAVFLLVVGAVVALSFAPALLHVLRERRQHE